MPRPSRFSEAKILDATARLVATGGPQAATIGAIGTALDAPWGSIYHRFPTRAVLLGRLWLGKAALFQDRFVMALAHPEPRTAGLEAALSLPRAARADFAGARILLLHRREDFFSDEWPRPMRDEAAHLRRQVDDALGGIARRLFGRGSGEALRLATFAILDVAFAATHRHIVGNEVPPPSVDGLVEKAYLALIPRERMVRRAAKA